MSLSVTPKHVYGAPMLTVCFLQRHAARQHIDSTPLTECH